MAKNGAAKSTALTVQSKMDALAPRLAEILPKAMDAHRYVRLAKLMYAKDTGLHECNPITVLSAVMDAGALGLELGREAHLVKFGKVCQMLPDYRGYQKLARQSGLVRVIEARVVYNGDAFDYEEGTAPSIRHKPNLSASREDDNVLAFYAVAFLNDGTTTFLVRTPEQINRIREKSRAKNNGPWVTDWQPMGLKTVIKELCDKRLPQTDEKLTAAIELDNRYETGEITRPLETDTEQEIRDHVRSETEAKLADLKKQLGADSKDADKAARTEEAAMAAEEE
jgi:recombination protein RecT